MHYEQHLEIEVNELSEKLPIFCDLHIHTLLEPEAMIETSPRTGFRYAYR